MGCRTFWQMTQPIESYVGRCVSQSIAGSGVSPKSVNYIVFSTMDNNLRHLDVNFARNILEELGLVNCVPVFVSMQQCASSLAALNYARGLFLDPNVNHVLVVAFDFVVEDADRIQPFALFGDAVTSCMMVRGAETGLSLLSYGVNMDFAGLLGRDNFESRKRLVLTTQDGALKESSTHLDDVEMCFSTNFYKPISLFNAGVSGIKRNRLCVETLNTRAHCGNCDWMLNLMHYQECVGLTRGKKYLVQAFAPGFFACGLLESC
ncbi:hypothetical protein [Archangium lansingense]|uniref:Beta-ketoacyl-[acyl-carrier-protein] synthase III N-terminal domain-containing protein n=1 Tax=Archangium lansingense TaxID=2995310 RepID=A0ABT4ACN8_9BACT|nr:hypothetical protein [Archangium lansinium]MCY1079426.1 hypothetical protein [Archangium lansinium]